MNSLNSEIKKNYKNIHLYSFPSFLEGFLYFLFSHTQKKCSLNIKGSLICHGPHKHLRLTAWIPLPLKGIVLMFGHL